MSQVQSSHDRLKQDINDDEPVFDFDVVEAYGLKDPHFKAPTSHHTHAHMAPGHEDLSKAYHDLLHEHSHI